MVSRRRPSRKTRKTRTSRKSRRFNRSRRHRGGFVAPVGDRSMVGAGIASLAQGAQFAGMHRAQHGGHLGNLALDAGAYPGEVQRPSLLQTGGAVFSGAPMAAVTDSVLSGPTALIDSTRTGPLNAAFAQISGMRDQTGGRRKKNKKGKKSKGRSRRQRGGFAGWGSATPAPSSASYMTGVDPKAGQLNHEWDAARNPNYYVPKQ